MKKQINVSLLIGLAVILFSCTSPSGEVQTKVSEEKEQKQINQFDIKKLKIIEDLEEVSKSDYLSLRAESCDSSLFLKVKASAFSELSYYDKKNNHINSIDLEAGKLTFKPDSKNGFYYIGSLPKSQSYVLTENSIGDGGLYFGNIILVNKADIILYRIISGYSDGPVNGLAESPDGKILAYYEDGGYDQPQTYLTVLRVNKNKKGKEHFQYLGDLESKEFQIQEMRWLNNNTLVVRASNKEKQLVYYKVSV